jgi:hypothetical protein
MHKPSFFKSLLDPRASRAGMLSALILTHIALPASTILCLLLVRMTFTAWIFWAISAGLGFVWLFLVGYWGTIYWHLRYGWLGLLAASVFLRGVIGNWEPTSKVLGWATVLAVLASLPIGAWFLVQIIAALRARRYPVRPVDLVFPFGEGTYVISDGGNGKASRFVNYHYAFARHSAKGTNKAMAFAVDIVETSPSGAASLSLFPALNERYPIFGRPVLSPCNGTVAAVENSIPDNPPFGQPRPYNLGNHIIVRSGDFQVLLGHLRQGSVILRPGDRVQAGQPVAQAGNSGWTERPHLHMQAMEIREAEPWKNEGLPILFEGRNPVKNTRFHVGPVTASSTGIQRK